MYTPASDLFERVIDDLRTRYDEFGFHTERDVVWTIQKELVRRIRDSSVALRVVNDYPILPGNQRSLTTEITGKQDVHTADHQPTTSSILRAHGYAGPPRRQSVRH